MHRSYWLSGVWCLLCFLVAACSEDPSAQDGLFISPTLVPATTVPDALLSDLVDPMRPDTGWIAIEPGISGRRMLIAQAELERLVPVLLVRLDPAAVAFRVEYEPGTPRIFADWCNENHVLAAINGGFFDETYHSTALVIQDGVARGSSYQGQGGMFAVDVTGNLSLRHLADAPYTPDEPLLEGIQGWPMLIKPGGQPVYAGSSNDQYARRSVLAMDRQGHVLFIVFPGNDFTLHSLVDWLAASDLDIDSALNLDGGSSTGLCVTTDSYQQRVDPFAPLPMALTVRRR